jgi:sugar transferase EpsL
MRKRLWLKRWIDLSGSLLLAAVTSPLLVMAALAILIKMGKPVLFSQERAGLHGKSFTLYKLRTMNNARNHSGELLPVGARLTKLGQLLRHLSIDELPQLWNVIRGDMSLIGPRPLLSSYLPRYNEQQARRHEMKPGLTGYAQVTGRNALTWEQKFELDVWYVSHWSLGVDLKIAAKTLGKVLSGADTKETGVPSEQEFSGEPAKQVLRPASPG